MEGDYGSGMGDQRSLAAEKWSRVQSDGNQNQEPDMDHIDHRPGTSAHDDYGAGPNDFNISHLERDTPLRNSFPSRLLGGTDLEGDSDASPGIRVQALPLLSSGNNMKHSFTPGGDGPLRPINLSY